MRNQIWEFALGGSDFCIEHLKKNSIVRIKPTAPLINTPAVAILRTCRQIYAEAALYPYKSNEFRLVVPTNGTSLSRPLPQFGVSMIRDLHVDLLGWLSRGVMGALLMPTFTARLASRLPQLRRIVLDVSMTSSELCVAVNETPLSEQCATMTQGIKDLMIGGRKDFMVVFEARLLG
ncbi:hypothetical protein J1614_002480 [Plenodomus biglobosus]|nr:hypothetical protein J1614_002480 [Plenodomus biglobosus]